MFWWCGVPLIHLALQLITLFVKDGLLSDIARAVAGCLKACSDSAAIPLVFFAWYAAQQVDETFLRRAASVAALPQAPTA